MRGGRTPRHRGGRVPGGGGYRATPTLPLIDADELAVPEDVPRHRHHEVVLVETRWQVECLVERVELEVVMVDAVTLGGRRSPVAEGRPAVSTLHGAARCLKL